LFKKPMKMRDLEVWGVPSYMVDIWEKSYSPYLLPVQEKAVRDYGVLDYEEGKIHPHPALSPQGRGLDGNQNLLVIAPTSSGKTFIGEMAAITQVIHKKKTIYLIPLKTLAEEKHRHFKRLYSDCGFDITISSRDRKEDDKKISQGQFQVAIMVYEKFNYFLLKYPSFLSGVSLVVIDELQVINNPERGPLLEEMLVNLQNQDQKIKIISLSAFLENQEAFLKWFPSRVLTSYRRPVELRKGIVRDGVFKYITHNEKKFGEEVFFPPQAARDNCQEDYIRETARYFAAHNEPTLLFFPTKSESKKWAEWLAERLECPPAEKAIEELNQMEETLSRDILLPLLEKGIAYHNADLSWEERNLVENYLRRGEIKVICATTTLAMGVNLPFKNVILSMDKIESINGDNKEIQRTSLTFTDIENMGGRAGRLNSKREEEFGRVIFLAHSLLSETIYQNLYFNFLRDTMAEDNKIRRQVAEEMIPYPDALAEVSPQKKERDLTTLLLRLMVKGKDNRDTLLDQSTDYWQYVLDKKRVKEEMEDALQSLKDNQLAIEDSKGRLSPTSTGLLISAKGIKVATYLYFLSWIEKSIKGEISDLEIILTLTGSEDGKSLPIPYPQFYRKGYPIDRYNYTDWKEIYRNKLLALVFNLGEEGKEIYQGESGLTKGKTSLEDYLAFKKTLLLYDWIGERESKSIEQEYSLYRGAVERLGEGFSWLADSLAAIAEESGWNKGREEDVKKIRRLSERMVEGVEEEGLALARLYIPGLSRYYIGKLVREGYNEERCLEEVTEEELGRVLPERLVKRIKGRIKEEKENQEAKKQKVKANDSNKVTANDINKVTTNDSDAETEHRKLTTVTTAKELKTEADELKPETILEIDPHRPDRIIFLGKEVKVTSRRFSLLYLLAQHNSQVMSYDTLLDELWKDEDAIYARIIQHIYKFRRDILDKIGHNKTNKEKVKDIFKVISGRGVMLNINDQELKIN
jgi:helicase